MGSYSVMGNYLQHHAYMNVWCNPARDTQAIFKLPRFTPYGGTWNTHRVLWRTIKMPDATSRFHLYQIGEVNPKLLGYLTSELDVWLNFAESCTSNSLMVDIYTENGIQIHRTNAWYRVTKDKNLIIALEIPKADKFDFDLNSDDVYIRFYSNGYYETQMARDEADVVKVNGKYISSTQDILDIQTEISNLSGLPIGYTYCFVNGYRVDTIDMITAVVGDYVEYVYDGSVKSIVTFNINSLRDFVSTLDGIRKYLLHYAASAGTVGVVDYQDDIDLYLVLPSTINAARYKGVYVHKNSEKTLRMVTHRDYAVAVQFLDSYVQQVSALGGNIDALKIIMQIRETGENHTLGFEHHRIKELYKMADSDIVSALMGIDSTVDVWKAESLEASSYTAIMRANLGDISPELVTDAYGYNAISKILGDTPSAVVLGLEAPIGLQLGYTAYEYDSSGLLLGYKTGTGAASYTPDNASCTTVEFFFGQASNQLDAYWGGEETIIDPNYNYRFYTCDQSFGVINYNWTDVTNTSQFAIDNATKKVTWLVDSSKYTLVRSNKKHLVLEKSITSTDGLYRFSISEYLQSLQDYRNMNLPLGKLDIFMNGRTLTEGLDYYVEFPNVTIWNKEYLDDPLNKAQKFLIRFTGFCDSSLKREVAQDVGFVKYGVLSFDNHFEVRDDKVNRICVDGKLYRIDQLSFAENSFVAHVTDALNGKPYIIDDVVVPMNEYVTEDNIFDPTYDLRSKSQAVDKAVSDYLTLKLPQPAPTSPSSIVSRYQIVSPFFCKIIYDLKNGGLWYDAMSDAYNDNDVKTWLEPYMYLLTHDPVTDECAPSNDFVVIHPHNLTTYVEIGVYQYKLLKAAVRLFGNNRIDLSSYVSVTQF